MKITSTMPDTAMLDELGDRAKRYRVGRNWSQAQLATVSGVSPRTIERLEAGSSVQLDTLVRILAALNLTENLDQLIPETSISPIQLAGSKTEMRQRARKRKDASADPAQWQWGDRK